MADFTLAKPFKGATKRDTSRPGNIAYAVFVLLCFWAGAQLLNLLMHAPGVFEHLMQAQDITRPHVEMGMGVGTIFGLVPFIAGSALLGIIGFVLRLRRHYSH